MTPPIDDQISENVDSNFVVDVIFGELNLDQLKSKIDEISYFTNVIDEKTSNKYFLNAKTTSELWSNIVDLYKLEYDLNSSEFELIYDKLSEYLKTLYNHDFMNFILSILWINKQIFSLNDKTLNGSYIISLMIIKNKITMEMLHAINDISNNFISNKFSKLNDVNFQFISNNFKVSYFMFDLIAKKYMDN